MIRIRESEISFVEKCISQRITRVGFVFVFRKSFCEIYFSFSRNISYENTKFREKFSLITFAKDTKFRENRDTFRKSFRFRETSQPYVEPFIF
jgi:hypothetical protein